RRVPLALPARRRQGYSLGMARLLLALAFLAAIPPAGAVSRRSTTSEIGRAGAARLQDGKSILEPGEPPLELDSAIPQVVAPDRVQEFARSPAEGLQDNEPQKE